jgi:hypothetical protein
MVFQYMCLRNLLCYLGPLQFQNHPVESDRVNLVYYFSILQEDILSFEISM